VTTGAVTSLEALVRWQHPQRGLVPPSDFVPLAERSGLMRPLTQAVLGAALREARTLRQNGMPVGVSVNLSTRNLLDPELAELVQKLLETWQVEPKYLSLEITESNMVSEPQRTLDVLAQLRRIGVRLAVDDFGTGYSSLQYLNRLPVDAIKIDKSFVRAMTGSESSTAIVRATVDLGHNLGFTVVAEGVEDRATWDAVAAASCDEVQGFLVARAMPAEDLRTWLRARAAAGAAIGK
jgi:EAL domain-containing protein (putative c-di-GMP-specific phosphodiesterase class I)